MYAPATVTKVIVHATRRLVEALAVIVALVVIATVVEATTRNGGGPKSSSPTTTVATPASFSFAPSGVAGGGFVNVVAVDPAGSGLVLAGGDVSGIHRSTDWGQ